MKSKKLFAAAAATVTMFAAMNVMAAETDIVNVNGVVYQDLMEALTALNSLPEGDSSITLLNNIELPSNIYLTIAANQNVTLDLNGQTLSSDRPYSRALVNNGTLTINATNGGTYECTNEEAYGMIDNYGTLTINGGSFIDHGNGDGASIKNRPGSKAEINDGTFRSLNEGSSGNGCVRNDGQLIIRKGDFLNMSGKVDRTGIYCVVNDTVGVTSIEAAEIGDVKIDGYKGGLGINSGELIVNNAVVTGHTYHGVWITNDGDYTKVTINGGKYYGAMNGVLIGVDDSNQDKSSVDVVITDGEFDGKNSVAVSPKPSENTLNFSVTGGTYTTDISNYVAESAGIVYDSEKNVYIVEKLPALLKDAGASAIVTEEGTGTIRFITETAALNGTVERFGTYMIPLSLFESAWDTCATVTYDAEAITEGNTFSADLTDIPADQLGTEIYARSFVYLKGIENPETIELAPASVNSAR